MSGRHTRLMPAAVLIAAAGAVAVGGAGTAAQETEAARNAAFVRHCMGLMTAGSVDQYMGCWADEPRNNGRVVARERVRETVNDIITTFPDFKFTILQVVADGETVVVRATQSGTHLGIAKTGFNGGGLLGVAATGRRMEILVTHWFTVTDGRIVEQQAVRDDLGMMRQLGLAPSPPRPPSR
jgi:predicted ester cyclase